MATVLEREIRTVICYFSERVDLHERTFLKTQQIASAIASEMREEAQSILDGSESAFGVREKALILRLRNDWPALR